MADLKISQLPGATTPIAGTEVLPLVQSGTTKKVAASDLIPLNVARTNTNQTFSAGSGFGSTEDILYLLNNSGSTAISRLKFGTAALADSGAIGVYTQDASNGAFIIWTKSGGTLTQVAYANSDLTFHVNSNNLVFDTAAKGVNFTANTPAAGMTSQLLNWYEEGTWTGGVSFGGAATGITYSNTLGYYTRIGNVVTVSAYINLSNKGSATGSARITGLPFTCANNAAAYAAPSLFFSNLTYSGQVCGYVNINDKTIDLTQTTEAGTNSALTNTNFANNTSFILNLTYRAA